MAYKAGMTHVVRDVDRPGSKVHKKEIVEAVTVLEAPPMVVKRRFYKNWYKSKRKAMTKYAKYSRDGGEKDATASSSASEVDHAGLFEQEVPVDTVFNANEMIDVLGATRGHGTEGVVTRWASRPAEDAPLLRKVVHRRVAPEPRVLHRGAQRQNGYHHRTEMNKKIYRIGKSATPSNRTVNEAFNDAFNADKPSPRRFETVVAAQSAPRCGRESMSALESSQEEDLGAMAAAAARANLVFCSSSPVLIAAQTHHLYDDCKTFVDSPMRVDPEEILEKFKAVDAADEAAVRSFVLLDRRGLLVCDCYGAAKDMILNLLDYVEAFGFVPNGGRTYYLNRSQPPLLSDMVRAYLDAALEADDADRAAAALALAERATPLLVTEHDWWTRNKNVQVTVNGATYTLLCYRTAATLPRAESYREDLATAARALEARRAITATSRGRESGWDFVPRNLAALHRFVDAARRDGKAPLRVAWARAKEDAMEPPGERFVPGARFAPRGAAPRPSTRASATARAGATARSAPAARCRP
ncbi:hypothetical protein JL721_11105 [Aureococcus anophagefferens]|nr:hypothetical protein JL721_11105 [Aureococcus anophagefferens]